MRAIILLLLVSGCTFTPYWQLTEEPFKVVGVIRHTTDTSLRQTCNFHDWKKEIHGCTQRNPYLKTALIHLGPKVDDCILRHEQAHADGWMHDGRDAYVKDCGPAGYAARVDRQEGAVSQAERSSKAVPPQAGG